jgi:hypothetical protein
MQSPVAAPGPGCGPAKYTLPALAGLPLPLSPTMVSASILGTGELLELMLPQVLVNGVKYAW